MPKNQQRHNTRKEKMAGIVLLTRLERRVAAKRRLAAGWQPKIYIMNFLKIGSNFPTDEAT